MRILVISDIHANLNALEAVLSAAGKVDAVWCLGDLVGYGPDPNECIDIIRSQPNLVCLLGNHDAAALGQIDLEAFNREARLSARWMRSALTSDSILFLQSLPEKQVVDNVTLAHGSPRNPVWEYLLDTYTAAANFNYFDTRFCFVGHTHLPIAYTEVEDTKDIEWKIIQSEDPFYLTYRTIINPGSVGQPRDHDPRAAFAIFHPETTLWEPHRVPYDIAAVQQRIKQNGLPPRHAIRLAEGY
jgi:diadenosine tetraphosphatase ApaH/serine/threonine PP2A family protein phosphatase